MAVTVLSRCRDGGNRFEIGFWYEMRSTEFLRIFLEFLILKSEFQFVDFSTAE